MTNIDELITRLQEIRSRRGNIEVLVYDDWGSFPIERISYMRAEEGESEAIIIQTKYGMWSHDDDG